MVNQSFFSCLQQLYCVSSALSDTSHEVNCLCDIKLWLYQQTSIEYARLLLGCTTTSISCFLIWRTSDGDRGARLSHTELSSLLMASVGLLLAYLHPLSVTQCLLCIHNCRQPCLDIDQRGIAHCQSLWMELKKMYKTILGTTNQ